MTMLEAAADVQMMIQLKNNLGVAAYNQAEYLKAEQAWQEALQLNSKVRNPMEMAGLYNNLGMVYTQLQEWEMAELMLRQSARTFATMGDVSLQVNSLDNLVDLFVAQDKTAVARQTLREAIRILEAAQQSSHDLSYQDLQHSLRQRLLHL